MITKFDTFINEGNVISWIRNKFSKNKPLEEPNDEVPVVQPIKAPKKVYEKPDDDIGEWIIKNLKVVDEKKLKHEYDWDALKKKSMFDPCETWTYTITRIEKKLNELDPYGEEDWGDEDARGKKSVNILIKKYTSSSYEKYYLVRVNNQSINVSTKIVDKITELLNEPKERRREEIRRRDKEIEDEKKNKLRGELFEKIK